MAERSATPVAVAVGAGLLLCLLGCGEPELPPPYGFDRFPEQRFRIDAREETDVDGTPVLVQRFAEVRLAAEQASPSRTELVLYLERYYLRVEGAPGGTRELVISEQGIESRAGPEGDMRVVPDEIGPGGSSLRTLLARPIAGVVVDPRGEVLGKPWQSFDPLLMGVRVLDWLLLTLPVLETEAVGAWGGRRALPRIGQYDFGVDLPLRYELAVTGSDGTKRIRANGVVERTGLEIAAGLAGDLRLEHQAESSLDPIGRVREVRIDLRVRFEGSSGTEVSSRHLVKVRCLDCDGSINPMGGESDISS